MPDLTTVLYVLLFFAATSAVVFGLAWLVEKGLNSYLFAKLIARHVAGEF